jgi:hypothetical protein
MLHRTKHSARITAAEKSSDSALWNKLTSNNCKPADKQQHLSHKYSGQTSSGRRPKISAQHAQIKTTALLRTSIDAPLKTHPANFCDETHICVMLSNMIFKSTSSLQCHSLQHHKP